MEKPVDRVHGAMFRVVHLGPRWTTGGADTRATVHHRCMAHWVQQGSEARRRGSKKKRVTRRSRRGLNGARTAMEGQSDGGGRRRWKAS
jgi:hypothetical protein